MSKKLGLIVLLMLAFALTACERAGSQAPLPSPTTKNDFPQPLATAGMGVVEIAATQTAAAIAGVPQGTPVLVLNDTTTPTATTSGSLPGLVTVTPTATGPAGSVNTALPSLTPNHNATITRTSAPTQPTTQISKPATYTLHQGEFVFCLARRFNVDPDETLALNGLVDSETIYPGTTLKIPAGGSFPGPRALKAHPATYTVQAEDTIYGIACLYGDVDPLNIAAVNGLAAPYNLTTGAQIKIP